MKNQYLIKYSSIDPAKYPRFRYVPDPVSAGLFAEETGICTACKETTDLSYYAPFYSEQSDIDVLCPKCIADGTAAEKLDGEFNRPGSHLTAEQTDTLMHRTPGVILNRAVWPVHCNDYCMYMGTANDPAQMHALMRKENIPMEEEEQYLLHRFTCLSCKKDIFVLDDVDFFE